RARLLGGSFVAPAGRAQRRGEREARVGVIEQRVGRGGEVDGGAGEVDGGSMLATPRQRLRPYAAPGDRRLQIVASERLALVAQGLGLRRPALREQRAAQQGRGLRRVDPEPELPEPVVRRAEATLGGGGVALEQLDEPGEDVGLEQP